MRNEERKNILGIDPGLSGGLALYDGMELLVWDVPTFTVEVNGKNRKRIDIVKLQTIMRCHGMGYQIDHAFVEKVNAQPGNGTAAAYAYGYGVGVIDATVQCCGVPFTHVSPQKWKKALSVPADKDAARMRASQLMPQFAHCWSLKKNDGVAEAALIAYYGFHKDD